MDRFYVGLFVVVIVVTSESHLTAAVSKVDCSFDKPSWCGYRIGWDSMMKANWKLTKASRDSKIKDLKGSFAYFDARKRPRDFSARLTSRVDELERDECITFSYVNKGVRNPYPEGRSKLEVYFAPGGRDIVKGDTPIWTATKRTSRNKWKRAKIPLDRLRYGPSLIGSVAFVAVRGGSKRAYIGIDDISVERCKDASSSRSRNSTNANEESSRIRALPARRPVHTRDFALPTGSDFDASNPASINDFPQPARNRRRGRRRRKKNRNKTPKRMGVVYFTGDSVPSEAGEPFVPTLVGQERPREVCDFLEYTQELKRCLRAFFSMLKRHKSKRKCNSDYFILESCLKQGAAKCVPASEMPRETVHQIITDTMRNKFKTKQVYCLEEGAFVYPEFSLGSIPLQCSRIYFGKLTSCGGSFAGIFNFKHGDPSLCREYFQANECQRRTTAEECQFDTRSKLIYGLNLQYQFAHNPFCIDLPFSAWWPDQ